MTRVGGKPGLLLKVFCLLLILAFLARAFERMTRRGFWNWHGLYTIGMILLLVAGIVVIVVPFVRRPFVAVTPLGVVLRPDLGRLRVIPWSRIRLAQRESATRNIDVVTIYEHGMVDSLLFTRPKKPIIVGGMFQSNEEALELAAAIEAWLVRYGSPDETSGA